MYIFSASLKTRPLNLCQGVVAVADHADPFAENPNTSLYEITHSSLVTTIFKPPTSSSSGSPSLASRHAADRCPITQESHHSVRAPEFSKIWQKRGESSTSSLLVAPPIACRLAFQELTSGIPTCGGAQLSWDVL